MTSELKPIADLLCMVSTEVDDIELNLKMLIDEHKAYADTIELLRAESIPIAELEALPEETLYLTGIVGEDYIKASALQALLEKYK